MQAAHEIPLLPTVRTQYLTYRQLVREGRRSAKLEPLGPRPPLDMPAWGARLTDQQVDSILSYLLSRPEVEGRSTPQPHSSIAEGDVQ